MIKERCRETHVITFDDQKGDLKFFDSFKWNLASNELPKYNTIRPDIAFLIGRFAFDYFGRHPLLKKRPNQLKSKRKLEKNSASIN